MNFLQDNYLISNESGLKIFAAIKDLPILDPHNHADVKEIAENNNYNNLWQLFGATDHYVWEIMRKCDVPEEYITGDKSAKEKFFKLAEAMPDMIGNPVYEWIHLDLQRSFDIYELLSAETAEEIWTKGNNLLAQDDFKPQALLEKLNVETMCSTDDPIDLLLDHKRINDAHSSYLIRPTWRPDKAMNIEKKTWNSYIDQLANRFEMKISSITELWSALEQSHDYFAKFGTVASDHGVETPAAKVENNSEIAALAFESARQDKPISQAEINAFKAEFLHKCGELNAKKDWVFQLHSGAVRDVRHKLFDNLGPDVGGDISNHYQDILPGILSLLNSFDDSLKVVLYCLDQTHQPTLATVARAFGSKVRLGSAWWLCDTPIGMKRQLEYIGAVDTLSRFAGMVSDSRKLLSYGSRFEMFRRVLANVLGELCEMGQAPYETVEKLAIKMCYNNPKSYFKL